MARQAPQRDVAPAVQRLRLRYAKRGRLRFSSHRDFQRALERAVRRAEIPIAMSAGFSPHPKISYANAAPTGAASEAEYVELAVTERCEPESVRAALDSTLPPGLDVLEVVEATTTDFAARLEASVWQIEFPGLSDPQDAVAAFRAASEIEVERLTKSGMRRFDARQAVLAMDLQSPQSGPSGEGCAILTVVIRHGTPSVRPDDVITALRLVADLVPPKPPRVTRLAQGPLDSTGTSVTDPLTPDKVG